MPQLEKTLYGNVEQIKEKITFGMISNCPLLSVRGTWDNTMGDVRCITIVYEKAAPKIHVGGPRTSPQFPHTHHAVYDGDDYKDQPHYSLAVTLLTRGEEIRLCGITSGSGQDMYFIPYSGGEFELFEALDITLNTLDQFYF